jgi:hypothetical protein
LCYLHSGMLCSVISGMSVHRAPERGAQWFARFFWCLRKGIQINGRIYQGSITALFNRGIVLQSGIP